MLGRNTSGAHFRYLRSCRISAKHESGKRGAPDPKPRTRHFPRRRWEAVAPYMAANRCFDWQPNGSSSTCSACDRVFSLVLRRHHCRLCGSLVCESCSPGRCLLPPQYAETPVRICRPCNAKLVSEFDVQFNPRPAGEDVDRLKLCIAKLEESLRRAQLAEMSKPTSIVAETSTVASGAPCQAPSALPDTPPEPANDAARPTLTRRLERMANAVIAETADEDAPGATWSAASWAGALAAGAVSEALLAPLHAASEHASPSAELAFIRRLAGQPSVIEALLRQRTVELAARLEAGACQLAAAHSDRK